MDTVVKTSFVISAENDHLIDDIVLGGGFRGSGGGGPVDVSRRFAKAIKDELAKGKTIKFVDPADVPDDAFCATIATMGSPAYLSHETISFNSFDNCWRQTDEIIRGQYGQPLQFVMIVEIGSWNSLAALVIPLLHDNIYVIDGDGAGRAVPTLDLTRLSYSSSNPTIIASDGDYDVAKKIGLFIDDVDEVQTLAGAILTSKGFTNIAGVGLWPLKGKDMKEYIIPYSFSQLIFPAGQIMREAIQSESPYSFLVHNTKGARLIVRGVVTDKSSTTGSNALDLLNVTVEGLDEDGNQVTVVVYGMNENLFVFLNNQQLPAIVSPDMSCWATTQQPSVDTEGSYVHALQPLDNSNVTVNMDVALVGIPSNPTTKNDEKMMQRWKATLKPLGYSGEQVSGIFLKEKKSE